MTKLPLENRDVVGVDDTDLPPYTVGPQCSVPGCAKYADHAHHLFRRSFIIGDYKWVRLPDGVVIGNLAALCFKHHEEITTNKAHIMFEDGLFVWYGDEHAGEQLTEQPPTLDAPPKEVVAHDPEVCPTCNRRIPKPKPETDPEEKRERRTWAISVPADEREDGADTLDELLSAAREELDKVGISYSESSKAKFFVLSATLGLFVQHAQKILGDT